VSNYLPFKTVVCPDCGYAKAYRGHGYCRCGNYMVAFWKGMYRRRRRLPIPTDTRVWSLENGEMTLLLNGRHDD
jgi:hypothetical protein